MKSTSKMKLDDGWTVVTKGPSGRRQSSRLKSNPTIDGTDESELQPRLETLLRRYETFRRLFRVSQYWLQLRKTLDLHDDCHIESAVCLGLGSLGTVQNNLADRSLWQFVLFQEVTDYWQGRHPRELVERYAQEIKATKFDALFMQHVEVALLENPTGIQKITNTTFLYDPFLPWPVMINDVLPGISPAFYLGSTMAAIGDMCDNPTGLSTVLQHEGSDTSDENIGPGLQSARAFLKQRIKLHMPADFEHDPNVFRGMIMLVHDQESSAQCGDPQSSTDGVANPRTVQPRSS